MPSSRESSQPRDRTQVSHIAGRATGEAPPPLFLYMLIFVDIALKSLVIHTEYRINLIMFIHLWKLYMLYSDLDPGFRYLQLIKCGT